MGRLGDKGRLAEGAMMLQTLKARVKKAESMRLTLMKSSSTDKRLQKDGAGSVYSECEAL